MGVLNPIFSTSLRGERGHRADVPIQQTQYGAAEHKGLKRAINKNDDLAARVAYADYLEVQGGHASTEVLDILRQLPHSVWTVTGSDGKMYAGRKWTIPEIRQTMTAQGS